MHGAGQGKEMRWGTEMERENMKIYGRRHTYTQYIVTVQLTGSGVTLWTIMMKKY